MRSRLFLECPQMPVYFLYLVFFTVDKKIFTNKNIFSKHDWEHLPEHDWECRHLSCLHYRVGICYICRVHLSCLKNYVLFISFFSKMYNKKNCLPPYDLLSYYDYYYYLKKGRQCKAERE